MTGRTQSYEWTCLEVILLHVVGVPVLPQKLYRHSSCLLKTEAEWLTDSGQEVTEQAPGKVDSLTDIALLFPSASVCVSLMLIQYVVWQWILNGKKNQV